MHKAILTNSKQTISIKKSNKGLVDKVIIDSILNRLGNNLDYEIDISKICKNNNLFKIDLIANNPKSLFDLRIGLNRKKRSIMETKII